MNHTMGRVFLVGCPRSGTTLLQSLVAAHPDVLSLPETSFFQALRPHQSKYQWIAALGITSRRASLQLRRLSNELGGDPGAVYIPRVPWGPGRFARAFVAVMDEAARAGGKTHWLEKTPKHLFAIAEIQRYVPDSRFLHIVRPGPDVVASLLDVAQRYPDRWERQLDAGGDLLSRCVSLWNRAVRETARYLDRPEHLIVRYSSLVTSPESVLRQVLSFLSLSMDNDLISRYQQSAADVMDLHVEPWKQQVLGGIRSDTSSKFGSILSEAQQQYVLAELEDIGVLAAGKNVV